MVLNQLKELKLSELEVFSRHRYPGIVPDPINLGEEHVRKRRDSNPQGDLLPYLSRIPP